MAMLWTQVGSAPAYEVALGAAEVLAGLLLFWPRTATLGAMLSVISMAQTRSDQPVVVTAPEGGVVDVEVMAEENSMRVHSMQEQLMPLHENLSPTRMRA